MYALWLAAICVFACLHAVHLSADFPNHTPWHGDYAKYTDEGWYANAAIRAHLLGHWYIPGDFNPAPAVPVWPFLEWILFFFTGVSITAARGLAVGFFIANLLLIYLLVRKRAPRWAAFLALTLIVTSPFLYCFSRLAILEPMLTTLTLCALYLAMGLERAGRPVLVAVGIGVLFTLMLLTKTTAVFLLPGLMWAMFIPFGKRWREATRFAAWGGGALVVSFGLWMVFLWRANLLGDYRYLFFVNHYPKPANFYWPIVSLWWSFHGGLWMDRLLVPLAGLIFLASIVMWRRAACRRLCLEPVFGSSVLFVAGYILFMTYQDHPQPRYFGFVAYFCFVVVALGVAALVQEPGYPSTIGKGALVIAAMAVAVNGAWTLSYVAYPSYTWINAARQLTEYVDAHPNGNRLLVSISGDEIMLASHLPALCDDFGTEDLPTKLMRYQPGWYAAWNSMDRGTLEDLHMHYSLEQVASFHAFDDPDRDVLVLFKLHAVGSERVRDPEREDLEKALPGDRIQIPIE